MPKKRKTNPKITQGEIQINRKLIKKVKFYHIVNVTEYEDGTSKITSYIRLKKLREINYHDINGVRRNDRKLETEFMLNFQTVLRETSACPEKIKSFVCVGKRPRASNATRSRSRGKKTHYTVLPVKEKNFATKILRQFALKSSQLRHLGCKKCVKKLNFSQSLVCRRWKTMWLNAAHHERVRATLKNAQYQKLK